MKDSAEYHAEFVRRIEAETAEGSRSPWYKALRELMRGGGERAQLSDEEIGPWNSLVYADATGEYVKALDYYRGRGIDAEFEPFVKYCRLEQLVALSAESKGDLVLAAKWYEKSKMWDEALRCHRAAGREVDIARMLEKTGALEEALVIRAKLGNLKDMNRIMKAMKSKGPIKVDADSQLPLF